MVAASDPNLHLVGPQRAGEDLDQVVLHLGDVVQNVEQRGGIERRPLELNHLPLAPEQRAEPHRVAAAAAGLRVVAADVARAEAQQRHPLHAERGDGHLARLAVGHRTPQWCPHSVIEVCISVEA